MSLRCLIVDDTPEFLDAASVLLDREGLEIVGVAGTGTAAARLAADLRPDVILADIDMGGENGFALAKRLIETLGSAVILISAHAEEEFADMLTDSPAIGFIPKAALSASAVERVYASRA